MISSLGNYGQDEAIDILAPFIGQAPSELSIHAIANLAGISSARAVSTLIGVALAPGSKMDERITAVQSIQKSAYQIQEDASLSNELWVGYLAIRQSAGNADLARAMLNVMILRPYNPKKLSQHEYKDLLIQKLGGQQALLNFEKEVLLQP